jgi:hypothetical protein
LGIERKERGKKEEENKKLQEEKKESEKEKETTEEKGKKLLFSDLKAFYCKVRNLILNAHVVSVIRL